MALAFDTTTKATQTSGSTLTWSHTCTGSNRLLIVSAYGGNDGTNITGITYGGVAMSFVAKAQYPANNSYVHTYILVAPTSGANNVVVSYTTGGRMAGVAVSYTGAAQSGQPVAYATITQGNAETISTTVSVDALTDCWGYAAEEGSNVTYTNTIGYSDITTMRDGYDDALGVGDSGGAIGTGTRTMGFTGGTNHRGLVILAFKPVLAALSDALMLGHFA